MKQQQSGFTLIELIAVIVILGILAAVAVPKFVDLTAEAEAASAKAMAGNLGSAGALNYAKYAASTAGLNDGSEHTAVDNCEDAKALLQSDLPTGYEVTRAVADNSAATTCTLTGPDGISETFELMGTTDPAQT